MLIVNKTYRIVDDENEEFYGAVTLKTLCAEKEYMDYVLKRNY